MDIEFLERTIFIGGIPDKITETELAGIFTTFGEIRKIIMLKDKITGKQRGFAFIEYEEQEDAEHAIENYDNTEIYGKVIRVKKAKPKKKKFADEKAVWDIENIEQDQDDI